MLFRLKEAILAFTLVLGVIFLVSCTKSTAPELQPEEIYGTWAWLKSVGGVGGWELTPKSEGYRLFYVFQTDGTFELYKLEMPGGQTLEVKCKFWVAKEKWSNYPDSVEVLYYQNNQFQPQRIEFIENTDLVVLHDLCIDCFDYTLERID